MPKDKPKPRPRPKQWTSQHELVEDLKNAGWKPREGSKSASTDWKDLIKRMVGANVFRVFPGEPSKVFRPWAYGALFGRPHYWQKVLAVKTRTEYDAWLHGLTRDLRRHWKREMGYEISFGPSLKVVNLVMKGAINAPEIPKATYNRLVQFLHVPLDIFTIEAIRNCIDLDLEKQIGRIPSSATMGFVKTPKIYDGLQEAIRRLAKKAKVPPIAFDFVWDSAHPVTKSRKK